MTQTLLESLCRTLLCSMRESLEARESVAPMLLVHTLTDESLSIPLDLFPSECWPQVRQVLEVTHPPQWIAHIATGWMRRIHRDAMAASLPLRAPTAYPDHDPDAERVLMVWIRDYIDNHHALLTQHVRGEPGRFSFEPPVNMSSAEMAYSRVLGIGTRPDFTKNPFDAPAQ